MEYFDVVDENGIPTGETVGPISLAIAINGEPVAHTMKILKKKVVVQ